MDVVNGFRDRPAGTLQLNVPVSAARLVLPSIVPPFLAAFPDIQLEIIAEDSFVDVLAAGCDAGIRYDERLEQDMIAVPIGPRIQRFATAASPAYLHRHGRPEHPRDLLGHTCLRGRFSSGTMLVWEFERDGEVIRIDPKGPLLVSAGGATDLAVRLRSPAPASSPCSRIGCVRTSMAARWNLFSSPGGHPSPGRSFTSRGGAWYPPRSGRSLISCGRRPDNCSSYGGTGQR